MESNITIIKANKRKINLGLKELISYKDLFFTLALRDFKVRYAQTFLGLAWAIIQPLTTLAIFVLIFGKAIKVDTGGTPYILFALSGMAAWSYFAYVFGQAGQSVIGAQNMVQKVYFPRLIIPLSKSLTGLVDLAVTFTFLIILMFYYGHTPSSQIIYLPLMLIILLMITLGVGIWLSALTIRYRDFQHIIPFMVQLGLYATPIAYPASMIPEKYKTLFHLNPMAGIVEGFRWCILGTEIEFQYLYISVIMGFILFITSLFYFKKVEKIMADII